jgi:hypothetical protein
MKTYDVVEVIETMERIGRPYIVFNDMSGPVYDYVIAGLIETYLDSLGIHHITHEIETTDRYGYFVFAWETAFGLFSHHFMYYKEENTFGLGAM